MERSNNPLKKTFVDRNRVQMKDNPGNITFCENPTCKDGGAHNFNEEHDDGLKCSKCNCTAGIRPFPYRGHEKEVMFPNPNPKSKIGGKGRKIRKKKTKRKQKKSRKSKKRRTRSRK